MEPPDRVRARILELKRFPAYLYDLAGLAEHAAAIRTALPVAEIFYAVKANPDARILAALEPYVDGFEVSSGGELTHVTRALPGARMAFGGPGKTDEELDLALRLGVDRVHVESPRELQRLGSIARRLGHEPGVLLRASLDVEVGGAALTMSGPFGMDDDAVDRCLELLPGMPWVRLHGVHAHLASGLAAPAMLELAGQITRWADDRLGGTGADATGLGTTGTGTGTTGAGRRATEVNLGGGMAVDYRAPAERFDWAAYGAGLARLARAGRTLRIEPGRALTAYHGWYVTDVLEVKHTRGETFAVLRGGTHHLRTPVAKGHDQPFALIPGQELRALDGPRPGPQNTATLVGQLCTPKDVFARDVPVGRLRAGDIVAFAMAGAYAWNISHHGFLMHAEPDFHYLSG